MKAHYQSREHRMTIKCRNPKGCASTFRIAHYGLNTSSHGYRFCPKCGLEGLSVNQDNDLDYWEVLANHYKLPIDVTKQLYELWDRSNCQNFGDFVREFTREVIHEYKQDSETAHGSENQVNAEVHQ